MFVHITNCFSIVFNKTLIETITYIYVYNTHCIHIRTYFMKHILVIKFRASKARVPKHLLLNATIYIYIIYDILIYILYLISHILYITRF